MPQPDSDFKKTCRHLAESMEAWLRESSDFKSSGLAIAAKMMAIDPFRGGDQRHNDQIAYLLGCAKQQCEDEDEIVKLLAAGLLLALWSHGSQGGLTMGDEEAQKRLLLRKQFFVWNDELALPVGHLEATCARLALELGAGSIETIAYCLATGAASEGFLETALFPAWRLASAGDVAFAVSEQNARSCTIAQHAQQMGARWSEIDGMSAKDGCLRLFRKWSPFISLGSVGENQFFSLALSASLIRSPKNEAAAAFYRECSDWIARQPNTVNSNSSKGVFWISHGPYDYPASRCAQAAHIAREAGADLDQRDESGRTLVGWANEWSKSPHAASQNGGARGEASDWTQCAIELLQMGVDPWGLRQDQLPQDECKDARLKDVARAAHERWEIKREADRARPRPGDALLDDDFQQGNSVALSKRAPRRV